MIKIIAVSNQKGGSGKTTTAMGYFGCLWASGIPTIYIDTDKEGEAAHIIANNGDGLLSKNVYLCESGEYPDILEMINAASDENTKVAIIDTPAGMSRAMLTISQLADVIVVPGRVSEQDVTLTLKTARGFTHSKDKQIFIQPTEIYEGQMMDDEALEQYRSEKDILCLPSIRKAACILQAGKYGKTVFEYAPKSNVIVDYEQAVESILGIGLKL